MIFIAKIKKKDKILFLQSKNDTYWKISFYSIIVASAFSILYVITDFLAEGEIVPKYFLPRLAILIPLIAYIILGRKIKDYRILSVMSIFMVHCIMWCTIWALSMRKEIPHANEGYMIMHIEFFALGFSAPFMYYLIGHSLFLANILISTLFLDYGDNLKLMLFLSIPCIGGIAMIQYFIQKAYIENYINKIKIDAMLEKDALTNVYNRNKLIDICGPECRNFVDEQIVEAGIMMIDIDKFKIVNDTFGHEAGDRVLYAVAQEIQKKLSEKDYLIRWGGEEFVVIIPNKNLVTASALAENIRMGVENLDTKIAKITISIGVTEYIGINVTDDIKDADKAMYKAKQTGRNKVCVFKSEEY